MLSKRPFTSTKKSFEKSSQIFCHDVFFNGRIFFFLTWFAFRCKFAIAQRANVEWYHQFLIQTAIAQNFEQCTFETDTAELPALIRSIKPN